jgi:dienelactone hydrolase
MLRRMRLALPASMMAVALSACATASTSTPHPSPLPSPLAAHFESYVGAYHVDGGPTYVVNGFGHLVNLADDSIRQLYPTATADQLTYGPGYLVATPTRGNVVFHLDGNRADQVTITPRGGTPVTARRRLFKESEVKIPAQDATLAGTITEPLTPGPHPGIVIIHGSEPGQRIYYGVWVGLYASLGLTVLSYDKRGNGASTGTFPGEAPTDQNLATYADDAAAALGFLAAWPGVDARRVGYHGGSQGGWTVPLALQRHPTGAFAVLVSGPAVSTGQQAAWAGLLTGTKGAPSVSPSDAAVLAGNQLGYVPTPAVSAIRQPVLWLNGETDRTVPTALNTEVLQSMHKSNFDLQVLPHTDHGMLEDPTGYDEEKATQLAARLFDRIAAWLATHEGTLPTP